MGDFVSCEKLATWHDAGSGQSGGGLPLSIPKFMDSASGESNAGIVSGTTPMCLPLPLLRSTSAFS